MDLDQLQRDTRSSIELTRNAKGDYQWSIKRYYDQNADESDDAIRDLEHVDTELRRAYLPETAADSAFKEGLAGVGR